MARYDYKYVTGAGTEITVEWVFKMGEAPSMVMVRDADGMVYNAYRVFGAANLQRSRLGEWSVDLPPIDSPMRENS